MRVLICGGRDYLDGAAAFAHLERVHAARGPFSLVIEGGQRTRDRTGKIIGGADFWANQWAAARGIPCRTFEADWRAHNRAAGPIRNQQMVDEGEPDLVVALPGGRGTADMVRRASAADLEVIEVRDG